MTLIFLEMSQDSRHHLLPLPRSKSVLLKQAPALRVDVVAVSSVELTRQAIVQWLCLVFHSWRLCQRGKRWILDSAACSCSIQCRTTSVSKYLSVIQALYSNETIFRQRGSLVSSILVCCCTSLFPVFTTLPILFVDVLDLLLFSEVMYIYIYISFSGPSFSDYFTHEQKPLLLILLRII